MLTLNWDIGINILMSQCIDLKLPFWTRIDIPAWLPNTPGIFPSYQLAYSSQRATRKNISIVNLPTIIKKSIGTDSESKRKWQSA